MNFKYDRMVLLAFIDKYDYLFERYLLDHYGDQEDVQAAFADRYEDKYAEFEQSYLEDEVYANVGRRS